MVIKFHKKLYKKKAIEAAIQDYEKLADFILKERSGYYELRIKKIDEDVKDIIKDEFSNYVLSLMRE